MFKDLDAVQTRSFEQSAPEQVGNVNSPVAWRDFRTNPIPDDWQDCVLIYEEKLANDADFPGHPYTVSNAVYARLHWQRQGYTLWMPIPPVANPMNVPPPSTQEVK